MTVGREGGVWSLRDDGCAARGESGTPDSGPTAGPWPGREPDGSWGRSRPSGCTDGRVGGQRPSDRLRDLRQITQSARASGFSPGAVVRTQRAAGCQGFGTSPGPREAEGRRVPARKAHPAPGLAALPQRGEEAGSRSTGWPSASADLGGRGQAQREGEREGTGLDRRRRRVEAGAGACVLRSEGSEDTAATPASPHSAGTNAGRLAEK